MRKVAKILTLFLLLCIAIISSIELAPRELHASTLSNEEILKNANFSESIINKLSDFTKTSLVAQLQIETGFKYEIMTLSEEDGTLAKPMGQIQEDDLITIITTSIHKVENDNVKEIKVKVYYEWINLPIWRLEDPIIVYWDSNKFEYQIGSFYSEDRYQRNGDYLHTSRTSYYGQNQDTFCWYADLKAGHFFGFGGTIEKLYGFGELILNVKDEHQDYGTSFIGTTYVHSKTNVETGVSIFTEKGFSVPTSGNDQVTRNIQFTWNQPFLLKQVDYGFKPQYFFYEKTQMVNTSNLSFNTTRLRCGYIENQYIILSPRRKDAGTAYLVYSFEEKIKQINVELTMWSPTEYFYTNDSSAVIQYKDESGNWITVLDLLRDITLSQDRTAPNKYTITFPNSVNEFRFYSTSTATGNRNKGRVCIGNMEIYIDR